MGGLFGTIKKSDCVSELFYGTDYNSHLGTKRAGMVTVSEGNFMRSIHNIENSYFRTKFEGDLADFWGNAGLGVISDTDAQPIIISSKLGKFAIVTVAKINNIANVLENGVLPYETVDGKLTVKEVTDARETYEKLSKESKEEFSEDSLAALENYEKAVEMANLYAKLDGMYGYVNLSEAEQQALKAAYDEVKEAIVEFRKSEDYTTISAYIENNTKANYDLALAQFEE
jgi:predicted esterase YcpF (UPF0227 family)